MSCGSALFSAFLKVKVKMKNRNKTLTFMRYNNIDNIGGVFYV